MQNIYHCIIYFLGIPSFILVFNVHHSENFANDRIDAEVISHKGVVKL